MTRRDDRAGGGDNFPGLLLERALHPGHAAPIVHPPFRYGRVEWVLALSIGIGVHAI